MFNFRFRKILKQISKGCKPSFCGMMLSEKQVIRIKKIIDGLNGKDMQNYFEYCVETRLPRLRR